MGGTPSPSVKSLPKGRFKMFLKLAFLKLCLSNLIKDSIPKLHQATPEEDSLWAEKPTGQNSLSQKVRMDAYGEDFQIQQVIENLKTLLRGKKQGMRIKELKNNYLDRYKVSIISFEE